MEKFYIKTFGCQQNVADSERIRRYFESRGSVFVADEKEADMIVINSCMIRGMAEEKVYGYIRNLHKHDQKNHMHRRVILTGCIVGAAAREPSGKMKKKCSCGCNLLLKKQGGKLVESCSCNCNGGKMKK